MVSINFMTVFVAGFAQYMIGWVWYSMLFGQLWNSEMQRLVKKSSFTPAAAMTIKAIWSIVAALSLYLIIRGCNFPQLVDNLILSIIIWLGAILGPQLDALIFEGQSRSVFLINTTYYLVSYIVMSLIIIYLG